VKPEKNNNIRWWKNKRSNALVAEQEKSFRRAATWMPPCLGYNAE
jgi:hypothetical protein